MSSSYIINAPTTIANTSPGDEIDFQATGTNNKIKDFVVTTQGDLLYRGTGPNNHLERLPIGVNGKFLSSNGTIPVWDDAGISVSPTSLNATFYPTFVPAQTGIQPFQVSTAGFTFNPSTNALALSSVDAFDPVLVGTGTTGKGSPGTIIIGNVSTTSGARSISIGIDSYAGPPDTISLGQSVKNPVAGIDSFFIGHDVGNDNATGTSNLAFGKSIFLSLQNGSENLAIGNQSQTSLIIGSNNTSLGENTLSQNRSGNGNTGLGFGALSNTGRYIYNTGTASQTGFTITGVGTQFDEAMENGTIVFANKVQALLFNYISFTEMAAFTTATVVDQAYNIYYGTLYSIGNASQTGNTVTGPAATFTQEMVGGTIIYATGDVATITAFVNATTLTATPSQTIGSAPYRLYYSNPLGNTATGFSSGDKNTTGTLNTFSGYNAGFSNTRIGISGTVSLGANTVTNASNTTVAGTLAAAGFGEESVGYGYNAGSQYATGDRNLYIGVNTLGNHATFTGSVSGAILTLTSNATGQLFQYHNIYVNNQRIGAISTILSGTYGASGSTYELFAVAGTIANTFMVAASTGRENVAIGHNALQFSLGNRSVAVGNNALGSFTYNDPVNSTANFDLPNCALGFNALGSLTGRAFNRGGASCAFGFNALSSLILGPSSQGGFCAFGYRALENCNSSSQNDAFGYESMLGAANFTGRFNAAFGSNSLRLISTGNNNCAFGHRSLTSNTSGGNNNGFGYQTLQSNTTGSNNCALGNEALRFNTTGANNIGIGSTALSSNSTGNNNVALDGLRENVTGNFNFSAGGLNQNIDGSNSTVFGYQTANLGTTLSNISAFGYQALRDVRVGNNSSFGYLSGAQTTIGPNLSSFGYQALTANVTGSSNSAFGHLACSTGITENFNTGIGSEVLNGLSTQSANTGSSTTTITAASNGLTLPQATINVTSTTGFPASGNILVTTTADIQTVAYTGITATSFTGCTGGFGNGTMQTGSAVTTQIYISSSTPFVYTTVAPASNGAVLPQATINCVSTAGLPASGQIRIESTSGFQTVTYTGTTGTSFTGCTGGTGTINTGNQINNLARLPGTILYQTGPVTTGNYIAGMLLTNPAFQPGTVILNQISGTIGQQGQYTVSVSQSVNTTLTNAILNASYTTTTSATCTLSNILTVNVAPTGTFVAGMEIFAVGFSGLIILEQLTGTPGGVGTYLLSGSTYNFTAVPIQGILKSEESTALGYRALNINLGSNNTGLGNQSLVLNVNGSYNTSVGSDSLGSNTSGSYNTVQGYRAGFGITTGTENVCIGASSNVSAASIGAVSVGSGSSVTVDNGVALGKDAASTSATHSLAINMNAGSVNPGSLGCAINGANYQLDLYSSLFASTATAGGTTNLLLTSAKTQYFTGASAQTVVLPDVATLALGFNFKVVNRSTGALTIQVFGGGATTISIGSLQWGYLTYYSASGNAQASWSYEGGGSVV